MKVELGKSWWSGEYNKNTKNSQGINHLLNKYKDVNGVFLKIIEIKGGNM